MREIKFRGKDKRSGEWYYGNLYAKDTHGRTHVGDTQRMSLDVDPGTVGEWSGQRDKNGKGIYEDDLVLPWFEDGLLAKVIVYNSCFCFLGKNRAQTFDGMDFDGVEVVGNIHDNPELWDKLINGVPYV